MTDGPLSRARRTGRRAAVYPYLLLALSQLIWAGNWVVGRAVRDIMPPVALTFWRWTIAALCLAPFALPRLAGKGAAVRRAWRLLLVLGVAGAGVFQAVVYSGLRYTEAVNATLMYSASPLVIILMAWLLGVDRVTPRQLAGMVLSFGGIVVILARGDLAGLSGLRLNPGDALILLALPAWGIYSVLLPRRPPELDGIAFLFVISVVGALALAPFYALESARFATPHLTWAALGAMVYVGLFASVASYLLWNRGVELVGPNRAGFTGHLLPAFAAGLAVLLLGEELHLFQLIGIATILLGVFIATSARA